MATRGMSSGILDFGGTCPCWMALLNSATKSSIVSRNRNLASSAKVKCRCSNVVDVSEVLFKVVNNLRRELIRRGFHFGKRWPEG